MLQWTKETNLEICNDRDIFELYSLVLISILFIESQTYYLPNIYAKKDYWLLRVIFYLFLVWLNNSVDKRIEQITSFHFISENRVSDNSKKIGILPWTSSYPNSTVFIYSELEDFIISKLNKSKHFIFIFTYEFMILLSSNMCSISVLFVAYLILVHYLASRVLCFWNDIRTQVI